MQRHLLLLLLTLTPLFSKAQLKYQRQTPKSSAENQTTISKKIRGIVYDAETTVKGAKVLNITRERTIYTDENGEFEIVASVNDTLYFESLFHHPKYVSVSSEHFESTYVFELKKITNQLDAVKLNSSPKEKVFEEKAFNKNLNDIIELDKKNNPAKYGMMPKHGVDIVQLVSMIGKLFKKKKTEFKTLTYDQIVTLFETNSFFNQKLLTEDLKIPKDLHSLFFEFCEEKYIEEALLSNDKRLELLNTFMLHSEEFLQIVELSKSKD